MSDAARRYTPEEVAEKVFGKKPLVCQKIDLGPCAGPVAIYPDACWDGPIEHTLCEEHERQFGCLANKEMK